MAPKQKKLIEWTLSDLSGPRAVEGFRKAANAFTSDATRSEASARKVLIDEGIYTKSGKLSKNYSS
jgi:hypothetical protein